MTESINIKPHIQSVRAQNTFPHFPICATDEPFRYNMRYFRPGVTPDGGGAVSNLNKPTIKHGFAESPNDTLVSNSSDMASKQKDPNEKGSIKSFRGCLQCKYNSPGGACARFRSRGAD